MKLVALAVIAVSALVAGSAQAQAIYRCGQSYSQVPCPDGRIIDSSDPRTAAQRAEAKRVAIRERQLAARLDSERRAQAAEGAASAQGAGSLAVRAPAPTASAVESRHKPKSKSKKHKPAADEDFVAAVPDKAKPLRK